jgi:hypothetical protein
MRTHRAATDRPFREDIAAAVAAYDSAHPLKPLSRNAAQLLTAMFPAGDVCRRSFGSLTREGFGDKTVLRLLRHLAEAGFLSKERGTGNRTNTYRLHLPPRRQP